MSLQDSLEVFVLGCFFGFVLGYMARSLRNIDEKVERVEKEVLHSQEWHEDHEVEEVEITEEQSESKQSDIPPPKRDERGRVTVENIMLLVVVALVVWSSIQTAQVNSRLQSTLECLTTYNTIQATALSSRDSSARKNTSSEIKLWTQYKKLYREAKSDPKKVPEVQQKLNSDIEDHRLALIKIQKKRGEHPYANPDILKLCKGKL